MSVKHQKSVTESSEIATSNLDISAKFRIYKMDAESTERKLKDANAVIERLKEEINSSRDSEKNLRKQLSSAQNRLIYLQQTLKKVFTVSEQQRQAEKISQQIEQKVQKISEEIKHTREESQHILKHVSREVDLLKETENLRSILAMKTRENDLMKMEIQTLTTEKKNAITANQQKVINLENELEKLKQRKIDEEAIYGETLRYFQQQLEEKDQTIQLYEKERKGFLDDFEPLKVSEIDSDAIKYADGAIAIKSPKSFPATNGLSFEGRKSQMKPEEPNADIFRRQQSEEKSNIKSFKKVEDPNFPPVSRKQKPQLEFLMPSQRSSQSITSVKSGRKRRLFSANCNYYND